MNILILVLEIIGVIAFSISGAMLGIRKNMDIFGVCILGITTATGGGLLRDIVLNIGIPYVFKNPVYVITSLLVSLLVFFIFYYSKKKEKTTKYENIMMFMDTIGLGIFTIVGINIALKINNSNILLLIFSGVITGVGGGLIRDIMAKDIPYIFIKHIYACASLVGAIIYVILLQYNNNIISLIISMLTIVIIRVLAAKYKWNLLRIKE